MFLSKQELEALTDYKFTKKQVHWLVRHGYKFEIGRNGKPKVLRKHAEQLLGYTESPLTSQRNLEPDFAALGD